jgi:hypothetical protein
MPLFEYPAPLPKNTLYDLLGVGPEARTAEIAEARADLLNHLKDEAAAIQEKVDQETRAVEGLKEATQEARELEAKGAEADVRAIEAARLRRDLLRQKAARRAPQFPTWLKQIEERHARIKDAQNLPLLTEEGRAQYDAAHPPLALLRLADCTSDGALADSREALRGLRRELAAVLEARGEQVYHPSDLTRDDFTIDFLPNPELDGPDDAESGRSA